MKKLFIPLFCFGFCYHVIAQQKIVLLEDFSSNKNMWATGEIANLSVTLENGKYIIDNHLKNSFTPQVIAGIDSTKDYEVSVNIKTITEDASSFSELIFGSNQYRYYSFVANTANRFALFEVNNGRPAEIMHGEMRSAVKGTGLTNKLRLVKTGREWRFYINDSLATKLPAKKLHGPYIGMYGENIKAEYDDLKVTGTPIATSGSICTLFPLIFQSAKNNFEFVKGALDKKDPAKFYLSTVLLEDNFANVEMLPGSTQFFSSLKPTSATKAAAIKYADSVAAQIKKLLPAYAVIKSIATAGLPVYTITERINSGGTQPVARIEVLNIDEFSTILTIDVQRAASAGVTAPAGAGAKAAAAKKPVSGWLINDNFTNNDNNWLIDSTVDYQYKISNEHYMLDEKTSHSSILTQAFPLVDTDDYKIETELKNFYGKAKDAFGLCFGMQGEHRFLFEISNDGFFRVVEQTDSTTINIIKDWTESSYIHTGEGLSAQINKLCLLKRKNNWVFRINNNAVFSCNAIPHRGTHYGFLIPPKSTLFAYSFRIYDWTLAKRFPTLPKEVIYNNVFYDDFSRNKNDWGELDDGDVNANFKNGDYRIAYKATTGYYMPRVRTHASNSDDLRVELGTKHVAGSADKSYGLCFGSTDVKNANLFLIANDGTFAVGTVTDGNWVALKDWTESDAIRKDDYSINYLVFEQTKGKWNFYINDKLVYTCDVQPVFESRFGCYIAGQQTVAFNRLIIDNLAYMEE